MEKYMQKIAKADSLKELNDIIESAAFDMELESIDYCVVYKFAMKKAKSWLPK